MVGQQVERHTESYLLYPGVQYKQLLQLTQAQKPVLQKGIPSENYSLGLYTVTAYSEQLLLILVALMTGACSSMTLMVQALKRRMRCESWSRKWEHNMSQE